MKKSTFFFVCLMAVQISFGQGVGIGTATPAASAKLDVSSTTQGMLVPRMTTAQRTAISSPASGLLVYDLTTNSFWFKGGTAWVELIDSVTTEVHRNGPTMIYTGLTDNVGVGMITPSNKLDINLGAPRTGTHAANRPLYITGNIGNDNNGIEFRHYTGVQGIGFGYNTIYAAGSDADQNLGIKAKGAAGNILFSTNGSERMRVAGDGMVGIGVTNPNATLSIARGTAPNGSLEIGGTTYNSHFNFGTNEYTYIRGGKEGSPVIINDVNNGNVGIGTSSPQQKLSVAGNLNVDTYVGIGNSYPNVPLQFAGDYRNRKIVLCDPEDSNDDNNFFGFGVNPGQLRYQSIGDHVFYIGGSELMRITGSGRVGIRVSSPDATLEITRGDAPFGSLQVDGTSYNSHFNYGIPEDTYIRGGKAGAMVIINDLGDLGNVGIGTATPLQKLHVAGKLAVDNNVGIGNTDPHASLQFSNDLQNRKIVMYEGLNNDHAYYGFGVNGSILRYQVSNPNDNHVFYTATASGTSSSELMRIMGNGKVGIGIPNPSAMLEIARGTTLNAPNGSLQINGTTYASHFNYGASEDTYIRGGKAGGKVIINEYADQGNVGIGTTNPSEKLAVNGNVTVSGSLKIGYVRVTGANVDIIPGNYATATCNCPPGSGLVAIGGGFIGSTNNIQTLKSYANTDSSWLVYAFNDDVIFHTVQAFVVCARLAN